MKINRIFFTLIILFTSFATVSAQYDRVKIRRVFEIEDSGIFYLDLKIDAGEIIIRQNEYEREISVYLRFSEHAFDYDFDFSERNRTLDVVFDKREWIDTDDDELDAEIEVLLPAEIELDFECKIKAGEIELELGDLSLRRFYFKTLAGSVDLDFDEPNRTVMRSLYINTKVGETRIHRLGNARFTDAEINSGIGELTLDLKGQMEADARAEIDLDIGETDVFIPSVLGVKLHVKKFLFLSQLRLPSEFEKFGKYHYSRNYDDASTRVKLEIAPGIGDLHVSYH